MSLYLYGNPGKNQTEILITVHVCIAKNGLCGKLKMENEGCCMVYVVCSVAKKAFALCQGLLYSFREHLCHSIYYMVEHIKNNHGPCEEKDCGRCCDPVKIPFRKGGNVFDFKIPIDESGNPIRIALPETRVPENNIDTIRIAIYECLLYDKENKRCKVYDQRPDMCRNTSCVDTNMQKSIDKQYSEMIETTFIKMKK